MAKKKFGLWEEFKKFINRGNVVDMAIGVIVANAFKDIITNFTNGFISPIVGLISGNIVLTDLKWVLVEGTLDPETGKIVGEVALLWGTFVQSIIDFLIIAAVLFLVLKIVTSAAAKAKELSVSKEEKEAAEKAAAEAKAKEEAAKAAVAAEEAAKKARELETLELLRDIRNSLQK